LPPCNNREGFAGTVEKLTPINFSTPALASGRRIQSGRAWRPRGQSSGD
jgi:hypothetical protein